MTQTAKLALEDGTVFTGESFGSAGEIDGERFVFEWIASNGGRGEDWIVCDR